MGKANMTRGTDMDLSTFGTGAFSHRQRAISSREKLWYTRS